VRHAVPGRVVVALGVGQEPRHDRRHRGGAGRVERRAFRECHARLAQPAGRQVEAAGGQVVADVAGDVAQLEGEPQIGRAAEHRAVAHAHHPRHHQADDTGDVIRVVERVVARLVAAAVRVHREAGEMVVGEDPRQAGGRDDAGERRVRAAITRRAVERTGGAGAQ
jgi:hypothetical protein